MTKEERAALQWLLYQAHREDGLTATVDGVGTAAYVRERAEGGDKAAAKAVSDSAREWVRESLGHPAFPVDPEDADRVAAAEAQEFIDRVTS